MTNDIASLLQHLPAGVVHLDAEGRVGTANPAACILLGVRPGQSAEGSVLQDVVALLAEGLVVPPATLAAVSPEGLPLRLRLLPRSPDDCWLLAEPDTDGLPSPFTAGALVDALAGLQSPEPLRRRVRPASGPGQRVPVVPLLVQVLEDQAAAARRAGVGLAWQAADGDSPVIYGPHERIALTLREVVGLALDTTSPGGEVTFTLDAQGSDVCLSVQAMPMRDHWDRCGGPLGWTLLRCLAECLGGILDVDLAVEPPALTLRLPVGAPAQRHGAMALQQLRRFAQDREGLKARRSAKPTSTPPPPVPPASTRSEENRS